MLGKVKSLGGNRLTEKLDGDLTMIPKRDRINVEDFCNGKGENAIKICIPFKGDLDTVKSMLENLNR